MYTVKSPCTYILSTLYILVKLVKCLFFFSLPNFIQVNKDLQILSERELTFMFAICCRPSVCRLSVTSVHSTLQAVVIFGNISTAFGTLAIHWHPRKFLRSSSQGNLSVGGVKRKRGCQMWRFWTYRSPWWVSLKMCKLGGKLVLITNRKSCMSFRSVPKCVTWNDPELRNGPYFALFFRIW